MPLWLTPQAMAMPDVTSLPQGKYGPVYPKSPACYGFTIIAKIIPGREPVFHEYAKKIEQAVAASPDIYVLPGNTSISHGLTQLTRMFYPCSSV